MTLDENFHIDRIRGAGNVDPAKPSAPGAAPETTEFRRLLEQLESVARNEASPTEDVENLDHLREAMKKADDDFEAVMQLRKRLEEAYRNSQS